VGVSTYLALTFGTLLSSQGTDASFKTVSRVSPDVCPFGVSDSIRWILTGVSECFSHKNSGTGFLGSRRGRI
ncbi:hypothetical protein DTL70_30715, partial [Streptomyces diacarni]